MTPLDRIDWLLAIAGDRSLPPSALAVAVAIAKHLNGKTGDARPAKATMAELVGTDERAVRRMCRALVDAGWLQVEQTPGRACCTYTPRNPGTATRVEPGHSNPGSDANPGTATRVPVVANPGEALSPTRAPSPPEQGMNRGEQGREGQLAALRSAGAMMKRKGDSIAGEWEDLLAAHALSALLAAMKRMHPRDRWPSKVRQAVEVAADLPGLAERTVTPEEAAAVLRGDL